MKFVSVDGTMKRVAHTSGFVDMIGKDPVEVPVFEPATGTEPAKGFPGLKECAMAAGCIPFGTKPPVAATAGPTEAQIAEFAVEKEAFAKEKAQFAKDQEAAKVVTTAVAEPEAKVAVAAAKAKIVA
jgi:hypothetical protein